VAQGDEVSLRAALELEADHAGAVVALAELLVMDGRADEGLQLLKRIPENAESRRIAAVARTADAIGAPSDEIQTELGQLLGSVKTDDEARQRFVDLLEVMGAEDPRAAEWRKRLSTALF